MSTLQELRDRVRLQMDLDITDVPDGILDSFIEEGFWRTMALEQRWPFLEDSWDLVAASGDTTLPVAATVAHIASLRQTTKNIRLTEISQQLAEDNYIGSALPVGEPILFSRWNSALTLWPVPSPASRNYTIRGYRKPIWSGAASSELDGDARLHAPIGHFAVALAYAQLEDPELENTYMKRWALAADAIRKDLMLVQHQESLVLNGGMQLPRTLSRLQWGTLP